MIKSLSIKNFQSHLESTLHFSEGINVITGPSNNGKTAIIRALNWVISNRPQGLSFKSSFSNKKESCKVILQINDKEIIREKSNSINQYQVGSSLLFDTIGNDVPTEVSYTINLSEVNISNQFDKHFLLMDSAGEVGRTINKIVKLDDIDELLANITSKISSTNKELEIKKIDLDKLEKDLEKFKDFESIEKLVNDVVNCSTLSQDLKQKTTFLKNSVQNIESLDKIINSIESDYIGIEEKIKDLEQNWIKYHTNIEIAKKLKVVIDSVLTEEKIILKLEEIIKEEDFINNFQEKLVKLVSVKDVHFRLKRIINEWEDHTDKIKKLTNLISKDEEEFEKILKEFGCPLCLRKF